MSNLPQSTSLFRRVAVRMRLASFGFRVYVGFLAVSCVFLVALLASRLLGLMTGWFTSVPLFALPWTSDGEPVYFVAPAAHFLVIPALAVLIGLLWLAFRGKVTASDAARQIDRQTGTKDLFLTLSLLERSVGAYRPLVEGAAESSAPRVRAAEVVPFRWQRNLGIAALAALLVALSYNLPQFDPFGKVAASETQHELREEIKKQRKATRIRMAQLKDKENDEEDESPEVKKAIEDLKRTFQKAKPANKQQNLQKLTGHQKDLGRRYQKLRSEKLRDLVANTKSSFEFGKQNETLKKWSRELQEGSTKSLQQGLDELKQDLKRLAKTDDPVKKAELRQKIQKKLKEMERFASEKANSRQLSASLERAMKQLQASKMDGLSEEAMQALQESLDLSKLELEEIAQSARDLKQLEEALKTLQMAKQLNQGEQLDGEMCQGCQSLADYQELYAQLMAQMGQGEGGGEKVVNDGGRGTGRGGETQYDDESESGFKSEQAKSQITAGKVLLSLKTKGLSDRGDADKDYRQAVRQVRQGVSEAILQEQVPPGYHESIKQYFDTIDQQASDAPDEGDE